MPSWREHEEYCRYKGVDEDACKFANRLIDNPEENLPALLQEERLRKYLYKIFGLEWVYWISVEMKNYWKALGHGELHGTSKKVNDDDVRKFRKLIEEIAIYFYGEHGRQAVQLHFELDEADHVLNEIKQTLLRSIKGSCYIPSERRWLPASSLINMAMCNKDAKYVSRILIETGPRGDPLRNYRTFLANMRMLIQQKSKASADGRTFEQIIEENPQLKWLTPLVDEAKTSILDSGFAEYECPSCHRRIIKPEGRYYCKVCGPNILMIENKKVKVKDLNFNAQSDEETAAKSCP